MKLPVWKPPSTRAPSGAPRTAEPSLFASARRRPPALAAFAQRLVQGRPEAAPRAPRKPR